MYFKYLLIFLFIVCVAVNAYPIANLTCFGNCEHKIIDSHSHEYTKYNAQPTPQEICKFCYATMPLIKYLVDTNKTELFPEVAIVFCDIFKIIDATVCNLAVKEFEVT